MSENARPRRRRKSAASRVRPFWILIVVLFVGAIALAYWGATWPALYPKSVNVVGNRVVPSAEILAKAGIVKTQNVWLQKTAPMVKRVEAIPFIETAAVHRMPPANVTIAVVERTPFAVVRTGEDRVLVDHALRVLAPTEEAEALPLLTLKPGLNVAPGTFLRDESVTTLRDDDDALVAQHVIPTALELDKFGELVVTLRGGITVQLGDDEGMEKKIALIDPILAQTSKSGRRVTRIDLRAPAAPVVVFAK